jgi:hypothetical protein
MMGKRSKRAVQNRLSENPNSAGTNDDRVVNGVIAEARSVSPVQPDGFVEGRPLMTLFLKRVQRQDG